MTFFFGAPVFMPTRNVPKVESVWVGALTSDGATVVVRTTADHPNLVLAATSVGGTVRGSAGATSSRGARLSVTGLTPDTEYTYAVEADGVATSPTGTFRTAPAAGPASFTIALAGDTDTGSNAAVFDTIRTADPLLFIHLGDLHYANITTNSVALFHTEYDRVLSQSKQAQLYREVPTVYVWDDHCFAGGNSSSGSTAKPAAATAYRARVPHYPLVDGSGTGAIYHSFVIGRVRFLVTDQRSAASTQGATDNASKTVLGTAQKTWWKAQVSAAAAAGQAIVWVCPRVVGGPTEVGADHWGGFTTERTELWNYIKANALGRVVILAADMHSMGIDSGANNNFATGGGCPVPVFQCAPLDQTTHTTYAGPPTFSQNALISTNGVFGTMQVTDAGGSTIGVTWRGFDSTGAELVSYSFSVTV
jgi:alkaline phosphatase D